MAHARSRVGLEGSMTFVGGQGAGMRVPNGNLGDILGSIQRRGVKLWVEAGQLRFKAPNGCLTPSELESLREFRGQILALLQEVAGVGGGEQSSSMHRRAYYAPLAFTQLAHWHAYQLSYRRAIRQIASAVRLRGRLDVDALRKSIEHNIRRQGALRTRIIVLDGMPVQEVFESVDYDLQVQDLTALSGDSRESEVQRQIEALILEPIDVAADPLFATRLLRLRDDEHVLILAMEHMISDAFSMGILVRDLISAYLGELHGGGTLPEVHVQFADFALWQRTALESRLLKDGYLLNDRLKGCQRLLFPRDLSVSQTAHLGRAVVGFRISKALKEELNAWSKRWGTTLVMGVLTAYVGLVLRWCRASEFVVQFVIDGRTSEELENTVGYFASVLYLRIRSFEDDTFIDLMHRVTNEYCKAYEDADCAYIAAQKPRPEFTRNTAFNWVPQASKIDLSGMKESNNAIDYSLVPFEHPMLKRLDSDHEPTVLFNDTDEDVVGRVYFSPDRLTVSTMERFAHTFLTFLQALLRKPAERVSTLSLV